MTLEGRFADFHLADIMQLIGLHQKSGLLALEGPDGALQVFIREGEVVGLTVERPPLDPEVAQGLVARGQLAAAKLKEALRQREGEQLLGSLLTATGAISGGGWREAAKEVLEDRLYQPFLWTEGWYRFTPQEAPDPGPGSLPPLRAENVLLEGIRRANEWPLVLQEIPSPQMVFRVGSRQGKPNPGEIRPTDVAMLKLVDGKRTVEELTLASGLGQFQAWSALAALVRANAISAVGPLPAPGAEGRPAPARPRPGRPVASRGAPRSTPAWLPPVAWAAAGVALLAILTLCRWEPLGILPLSGSAARSLDRVRGLRAEAELAELGRRTEIYRVLTGAEPGGLEALALPWGASHLPLQDPWGLPYRLAPEGGGIALLSGGPDRRMGTADDVRLDGG